MPIRGAREICKFLAEFDSFAIKFENLPGHLAVCARRRILLAARFSEAQALSPPEGIRWESISILTRNAQVSFYLLS